MAVRLANDNHNILEAKPMTWALDLVEDRLVEEDHLNPPKGDLPSHSYFLLDFYQNLVA